MARGWTRCLRCNERELINLKELNRSAGARCARCGGRLELSDAQKDRLSEAAGQKNEQVARIKKQTGEN